MLLIFATLLCAMTLYNLRGGLTPTGQMAHAGFDTQGFVLGGLAFAAACYFWGPLYGLALVLCVMVHEFGHVAAYRICGHDDARFRLIPLMGGVAISDRAPDTQTEDFFIALMGPAICLAPMVLGFALAHLLSPYSSLLSEFFWVFASVTAALNFFNLLPFWPLDGGRCLRSIVYAFWPGGARLLTLAMSAGFAAIALMMQSTAMLLFALLGAQSIFTMAQLDAHQRPMKRSHALIGLGAYFFTAAAHFHGGFLLLLRVL